jgi:hypothetical protein
MNVEDRKLGDYRDTLQRLFHGFKARFGDFQELRTCLS